MFKAGAVDNGQSGWMQARGGPVLSYALGGDKGRRQGKDLSRVGEGFMLCLDDDSSADVTAA